MYCVLRMRAFSNESDDGSRTSLGETRDNSRNSDDSDQIDIEKKVQSCSLTSRFRILPDSSL